VPPKCSHSPSGRVRSLLLPGSFRKGWQVPRSSAGRPRSQASSPRGACNPGGHCGQVRRLFLTRISRAFLCFTFYPWVSAGAVCNRRMYSALNGQSRIVNICVLATNPARNPLETAGSTLCRAPPGTIKPMNSPFFRRSRFAESVCLVNRFRLVFAIPYQQPGDNFIHNYAARANFHCVKIMLTGQ
jgi:hypothetical protein